MENDFIVTTVVTVVLAFTGYIITYIINLSINQRQERLERVNRQLKELYGPFFALTQASDRAWTAFTGKLKRNFPMSHGSIFEHGERPDSEKLEMWVLWMTKVFIPIIDELYDLLAKNSDLLIEEKMPDCILNLCAHVASYKTVSAKWEAGDFSEYTALLNYPDEIIEYSEKSYKYLKSEQTKLLGNRKTQAAR